MEQELLAKFFSFIYELRQFFYQKNFIEVCAPPLMSHPGVDPHIHPFEIHSKKTNIPIPLYLNTSPEFFCKKMLGQGFTKIFSLNYSYRDEPQSPWHRPQFMMLEWYRTNCHYHVIMEDIALLLNKFFPQKTLVKKTIQEIFQETLNFDVISFVEKIEFFQFIKSRFPQIPLPALEKCSIDDLFFLVFLNLIEPELKNEPALILYEYPAYLSALSTLKKNNPLVCERFELYLDGIEIANCFNELIDPLIQQKRNQDFAQTKLSQYHYSLPEPKILMDTLHKGLNPASGIALGVERFFNVLQKHEGFFIHDLIY
jgi:lysyl-tRNA synthetase class 2